jgi:hypothetical protein
MNKQYNLVHQERKFEDYPLTIDERFFKELLFLQTENLIKRKPFFPKFFR